MVGCSSEGGRRALAGLLLFARRLVDGFAIARGDARRLDDGANCVEADDSHLYRR